MNLQPIDDGITVPASLKVTLNLRADINGSPQVCCLDTGCSISLVMSQGLANSLNLPHGARAGIFTAAGDAPAYHTSVAVTIAGRTIQVDDAVVAPTHQDIPLIGNPVARQIARTMTVDWAAGTVEFDPTPDVLPVQPTLSLDLSAHGNPADYEITAVGSSTMVADGQPVTLDVPAMMIRRKGDPNARTMVPLRAPFEAMGCPVQWDRATRKATVNPK